MEKIVLYHGTLDKVFTPIYGKGNEKHDYGKGFYLTESIDLRKNGQCADQMRKMVGYINMNWIAKILKY